MHCRESKMVLVRLANILQYNVPIYSKINQAWDNAAADTTDLTLGMYVTCNSSVLTILHTFRDNAEVPSVQYGFQKMHTGLQDTQY